MRVEYGGETLTVPDGWRLVGLGEDGRTLTLERAPGGRKLLALPAPEAKPPRKQPPRKQPPEAKPPEAKPPRSGKALEGRILGMLKDQKRPITSQRMCMEFLGVKAPAREVRYLKLLLLGMGERELIRVIPPDGGERKRTTYALPG